MIQKRLSRLQKKIGLTFQNKKLLLAAITHPSYRNVDDSKNSSLNFQRLEFLGDAVLNFFIAKKLYARFPDSNEGLMSRMRSTLVSRKLLARVSRSIGLFSFLLIEKQESSHFKTARDKILADALEALIAAIYLDRGLKHAENFLMDHFEEHFDQKKLFRFDPNPKSLLQEYVQKKLHILPFYSTGLRQRDRFIVWVTVQGKKKTKGEGRTLREAEANAAAALLKKLKINDRLFPSFRKETDPKN